MQAVLEDLAATPHDEDSRAELTMLSIQVRTAVSGDTDEGARPGTVPNNRAASFKAGRFNALTAAQICAHVVWAVLARLGRSELQMASPDAHWRTPWFSLVQHKTLLVYRLYELSRGPGADADAHARYDEARSRLVQWIRAGIGTGDPRYARVLEIFTWGHG